MKKKGFNKQEVKRVVGVVECANRAVCFVLQKGVGRGDGRRGPHPGAQAHRQVCGLHTGENASEETDALAPGGAGLRTT